MGEPGTSFQEGFLQGFQQEGDERFTRSFGFLGGCIIIAVLVLVSYGVGGARLARTDLGWRSGLFGIGVVVLSMTPNLLNPKSDLVGRSRTPLSRWVSFVLALAGIGLASALDVHAGYVLPAAAILVAPRLPRPLPLLALVPAALIGAAYWPVVAGSHTGLLGVSRPNAAMAFADARVVLIVWALTWLAIIIGKEKMLSLTRSSEERAAQAKALAEQRGVIARELHDVVAHQMSVVVVQAQAAQAVASDTKKVRGIVATIETTAREALIELRRMLGLLRAESEDGGLAPDHTPQPTLQGLEPLIDSARRAGLDVTMEVEGDGPEVPDALALNAYRIIQESLTNVIKHAGPTRARVLVRRTEDALEVDIVDDGTVRGRTDLALTGTGQGLVGVQERASLYGGTVSCGPRQDRRGWRTAVVLPFDTAASGVAAPGAVPSDS